MKIGKPTPIQAEWLAKLGMPGLENFELPDEEVWQQMQIVHKQHGPQMSGRDHGGPYVTHVAQEAAARAYARVAARHFGSQLRPAQAPLPLPTQAVRHIHTHELSGKAKLYIIAILVLLAILFFAATHAHAQQNINNAGQPVRANMWVWNGTQYVPVTSGNPLQITCVSGCSAGGAFTDNTAFTVGTSSISPIGGYFTSGADPACTTGNECRIRVDAHSWLGIDCEVGCAGGSFNNNSDAVATSATNGQTAAWLYGFNGTTWDRLRVDGSKNLDVNINASSATVPVSGTFFQATQPVSCTTANCKVDIFGNAGGTLDASGQNQSATNWLKAGCEFQTAPTTITAGNQSALQCTSAARLIVDGSQVTQPVSGTITANQGTSPWVMSCTLANCATQNAGLPESTSTYAATAFRNAAVTTAATVKASAGNLYGWVVYNPNASLCVLNFYNTTSPTLGTTTPLWGLPLPATATANVAPGSIAFLNFSTAIAVAAETADGGASTCGTGLDVYLAYQ